MKPVVWGQPTATLAAELAAAGGHSFLIKGGPGAGKSRLLEFLQAILPDNRVCYEVVDPLAPRRSSELTALANRLDRSRALGSIQVAGSLDLAFVTHHRLERYVNLVDRFTIHAELQELTHLDLAGWFSEDTEPARLRVARARSIQERRNPGGLLNADLDGGALLAVAPLNGEAIHCLECAVGPLGLSNRARIDVLRVARTASDLSEELEIHRFSVALALCYRRSAAFGNAVRSGWLRRG